MRKTSNGGGIPLPIKRSPSKQKSSEEQQQQQQQQRTSEAAAAADAFDYFAANDPAESKLLNLLEGGSADGINSNIIPSAAVAFRLSSRNSPSSSTHNKKGGHRRRASKLQQFVKQISSRKMMTMDGSNKTSGSFRHSKFHNYGSQDEADGDADVDNRDSNDDGTVLHQQRQSFDEAQPRSGTRLYDTISSWKENYADGTPATNNPMSPPTSHRSNSNANRGRTSSAGGGGSGRRASARSSVSSHNTMGKSNAPDSEFLSHLTENLDASHRYDFEMSSHAGSRSGSAKKKTPSHRGHRRLKTTADALYDHAQHLENLFEGDALGNLPADFFPGAGNQQRQDDGQESPAYSDISDDEDVNRDHDLEGGADVMRPLLGRRAARRRMGPFKKAYSYLLAIIDVLGLADIWLGIKEFMLRTVLLVMVPLLGIAAILFYFCQNPVFNFLPKKASMSWWLIFVVRLLVTFNLARATQYLMEILTTRTKVIVRVLGPFAALVAMQSLGWPYLISAWGAWTAVLMHGSYPINRHWIWFLHIGMFTHEENPDDGVLENDIYLSILISMIFVGVATAAKRTVVALYLSRRMLEFYRLDLRDLLADMRLIMEVAELAAETQTDEFVELMHGFDVNASVRSMGSGQQRSSTIESIALTSLKTSKRKPDRVPTLSTEAAKPEMFDYQSSESSSSDDSDDDDNNDEEDDDLVVSEDDDLPTALPNYNSTPMSAQSGKSMAPSVRSGRSRETTKSALPSMDGTEMSGPVQWNELKNQVKLKQRTGSPVPRPALAGETRSKSRKSRKLTKLVPRLESWEEPETKGAKKDLPSLHDILQFRKAMQILETPYPFSAAFGKARTRKECIKSSVRVYKRLLKFTPGESKLRFAVIGALALDDDGDLDEKRAQSLLQVFLPDKDELLPQLSFVQSIDYVYKHLRFLRASILNSSKIDTVLEDAFDVIFNGILVITILTMLGLNPWPLLVSFSTLMVSFAFSFGPSCAKYIEGIIMIAVRRPYNIGDRITIIAGESIVQPTSCETWLVEDISLSTTTLRFSATNEISTLNNASIANARIVNGARSEKAIVTIRIMFEHTSTQDQLSRFRIRVENYLIDRPEIWAGLVHFRNDAVSNDASTAEYLLRAQHQRPWQDAMPIMVHRGELEQYMTDVAMDIGIAWRSTHKRVRIMEVPTIHSIAKNGDDDEDDDNKDVEATKKVEPFLQFMKSEIGL